MAKNSQFPTDFIGRGVNARATGLAAAIGTISTIGVAKTRITKLSIKAITIR